MPACLFLSPVTRVVIFDSDPSLDIAFRLSVLLVSKMQHFLPFHLSYYKPYSLCLFQSIIIYSNILCSAYVQFVLKISTFLGPMWAVPVFASPCLLFALSHLPNMLSFVSQAIAVCIPLLPSQNLKSSSPAHPGALLSSQGVWDVLSARGSWHHHLPLALELQAMLVMPRCFKHVNSCCCYS